MNPARDLRTLIAMAGPNKLSDKEWTRAMDKADCSVVRAIQAATKLEGRDHLCHMCLAATAANAIQAWNEKRKKSKNKVKK